MWRALAVVECRRRGLQSFSMSNMDRALDGAYMGLHEWRVVTPHSLNERGAQCLATRFLIEVVKRLARALNWGYCTERRRMRVLAKNFILAFMEKTAVFVFKSANSSGSLFLAHEGLQTLHERVVQIRLQREIGIDARVRSSGLTVSVKSGANKEERSSKLLGVRSYSSSAQKCPFFCFQSILLIFELLLLR